MRLSLIISLFLFTSYSNAADYGTSLEKIISGSKISKSNLGIVVGEVGAEQPLWELNSNNKMTPASLTKIMTAAAVLEKYSPTHQLVTEFLSISPIENSHLKGDLYFKGDGDPGFVSESMWFLVNELLREGITDIDGDLIVDASKFDDVYFDDSRDKIRVDRAYDSPIAGLTLNWSAVAVFVRPGEKPSSAAKVFVDPECDYFDVENSATTVSGKENSIEVSRLKKKNGKEVVRIRGKIGVNSNELRLYKAVDNPVLWAGSQAKCFLAQRGIKLKGKVRTGNTPSGAKTLAALKSKAVSQIVQDMMKFSNNYIAEIMTKNLGAQFGNRPAKMSDGIAVIKKYLIDIGLKDFELINPSGLTQRNKFKPIHFFQVLKNSYQKFAIFPEFVSSLPVGGVDGTLKNRLSGLDEGSHVRAKTGQLSGVIGLSGFIGRDDGKQIVFVFIYNGPNKEMFNAKSMFDQMALKLSHSDKLK